MASLCPTLISELYEAANLSRFSYQPDYVLENKPVFNNLKVITFIKSKYTDTECAICYNKSLDKLVVVFRGTEVFSVSDILTNIKLTKIPFYDYKNADVHLGFLTAFESIKSDLLNILKLTKASQVVFTGHSLGGSIATLAYTYFNIIDPIKCDNFCYTFGQPQVGDCSFAFLCTAAGLNNNYYRVVNSSDLIPKLPLLGFYHFGQPIYIDHSSKLHTHKHYSSYWQSVLQCWVKIFNPFFNHKISIYIKALC